MDRDEVKVNKNAKRSHYPAILTDDQKPTENCERTRLAHFARSGSQSEGRIRHILPTRGFGHIIMYDTNQSTCFDLRWGFLPLDIDTQNCRQCSHTDTHRFLWTVHTHSHLQWGLDKLTSPQWQLAMFRRNNSRTRRPLEKYGHLTPTSSSHLNSMVALLQNQ